VPAQPDAIELAIAAAAAADDKKATDLSILEVVDILAIVDLFVLATASNERQLKAVADNVEEQCRLDLDRKPLRREGTPESGWVLLDYGDVVVHLFDGSSRDFFALDRLWADVPRREILTGEIVEGDGGVLVGTSSPSEDGA
jgi:ribosome-associated protein